MPANILDASALLQTLPNVLPEGKKKLGSQQDGITALIHTVFTVLGFRLIGTDESGPANTFDNNVLPENWNQHGPGNYALRYRHEQSSLEFLVKVVKLGGRTLVNSIAIETDKTATLDISTNDFTSPSFFPHDLTASDAPPLVHGFISSNRIDDFVSQLKLSTLQKLMPGLRKEGYTEQADTNAGPSQPRAPEAPPARPRPEQPPFVPEDVFPRASPRNPLEIGRRDRDPFPANPFAPPPLFPDASGDGMFVGPSHPIFGAGMRGRGPGGQGPWGGDGFLPPLGAPPGARFDPIGPGPLPGPPPLPGQGNPRRNNGPFGAQNPDNDEFMPPGYVSIQQHTGRL
ncbi:PI31 proteasome regulator N-terminal-domain-containing protein [Trametes elegans]|nr:PI31 proteasome regulator N-terminal-domain-containing protein [Trametes elegans]